MKRFGAAAFLLAMTMNAGGDRAAAQGEMKMTTVEQNKATARIDRALTALASKVPFALSTARADGRHWRGFAR